MVSFVWATHNYTKQTPPNIQHEFFLRIFSRCWSMVTWTIRCLANTFIPKILADLKLCVESLLLQVIFGKNLPPIMLPIRTKNWKHYFTYRSAQNWTWWHEVCDHDIKSYGVFNIQQFQPWLMEELYLYFKVWRFKILALWICLDWVTIKNYYVWYL